MAPESPAKIKKITAKIWNLYSRIMIDSPFLIFYLLNFFNHPQEERQKKFNKYNRIVKL